MRPQPVVIDLHPGWTEPDGTLVYASECEAARMQVVQVVARLLFQYPRECLHALGLIAVGGICLYLGLHQSLHVENRTLSYKVTLPEALGSIAEPQAAVVVASPE
jgi:hypothetical protein